MDIVTMRIFDILACRGFVLADHSEELPSLFEVGTEVISWHDLGDLHEKASWYLNHPEERERIAAAGYARVLRDHTIVQRVEVLLERLRERGVVRG
jgi:spore maturation protein CgeB